jgi:hypothetical protein
LRSREELLDGRDVVALPKLLALDLEALSERTVLWGWPHCVQDEAITQVAIDHRLTLIAWEAMNHWTGDGAFSVHVFHKNNELAGYCSVLHALQIARTTGVSGRRLHAAVISFGATARGAVSALYALGVHDVTVLPHRSVRRSLRRWRQRGWRTTTAIPSARRSSLGCPDAGPSPSCSPITTSWSTASCRTPTIR